MKEIMEFLVVGLRRWDGLHLIWRIILFFLYVILVWFLFLGLIPVLQGLHKLDPVDFSLATSYHRGIANAAILGGGITLFWKRRKKNKKNRDLIDETKVNVAWRV